MKLEDEMWIELLWNRCAKSRNEKCGLVVLRILHALTLFSMRTRPIVSHSELGAVNTAIPSSLCSRSGTLGSIEPRPWLEGGINQLGN